MKLYSVVYRQAFLKRINKFEARDETHLHRQLNQWLIQKENVISIKILK